MQKYVISVLFLLFFFSIGHTARFNAFGLDLYTVESENFRIHYHNGLDHLVHRTACKLEELYDIFANTYHIELPGKTDVILYDEDLPNAFAYPPLNTIFIGTHNFDFNLRGSHEWFDDVITHEFAHIVSIRSSSKLPPWIPYIQGGAFSHPNEPNRLEALHVFPSTILPQWFAEGIAQYESSLHGSDRWDSHRDMIMRTLALSGNMLSWDHMHVFTGTIDKYENSYNHGFSLVIYIAENYGYEKVVSLLRECSRIDRLTFDGAVKAVLGISGQELYNEWQLYLYNNYHEQIENIGTQVFGRKISEFGFSNFRPRFSPSGDRIYYLSNGESHSFRQTLVSYSLSDTVEEDNRLRFESPISGNFHFNGPGNLISFTSNHSRSSRMNAKDGGQRRFDLFIDTLPSEPVKPSFFRRNKTYRQVTEQKGIFSGSFSPDGDILAAVQRRIDRYFLAQVDTSGENFRVLYPDTSSYENFFSKIYDVTWSPDGRTIALDYIDNTNRKIGLYDTLTGTFTVVCETKHDQRDPYFSPDGSSLYFSSDRTGIFNIYRFNFDTNTLEKLTNVSGGAFSPGVCPDEERLVYAGYDPEGHHIYMLDSIKVLSSQTKVDGVTARSKPQIDQPQTSVSLPRAYSYYPRQVLLTPTLISEAATTSEDDVFKGVSSFKLGAIINLMDPFAWAGLGTEIGAYALIEAGKIFRFFNFDDGGISTSVNYDLGAFAVTSLLPVDVTIDYMLRGVTGNDTFYDESEGEELSLPYKIQIHNLLLIASHHSNATVLGRVPAGFGVYLFTGFNRDDVKLNLGKTYPGEGIFSYNLGKGYRIGTMGTFVNRSNNKRASISPRGFAAKVQYDFWNQYSLKEENSFDIDGGRMRENYDTYNFHQINARAIMGTGSPLHNMHDLYFDLSGSYVKPVNDTQLPSFYLPVTWLPGYTYYYRDELQRIEHGDTTSRTGDTVLISGNAVLDARFSYRFPLWPGNINRRLSFIHFEYLYGAINLSGGTGLDNPMDFFDFNRADWLLSYGAEIRLQAQTFSTYPLAVNLRWDHGIDKSKDKGGHRFTFSIGFDFDSWGRINQPDYLLPGRRSSDRNPLRMGSMHSAPR
ncbi:hypothetical protein QA601_03110 [Chitinispirillales bacterium ANBcel5]|uniref:peptidase MA family metallohydrolase n=1 Tax=Cellulosispirillum alkaliphilum TaxID=3039283 RepID=UPI002A5838B4|nr:hypothetical protein [Chitinispirillales bacterium ANBcel5]